MRELGRTGIQVSPYRLGTMTFGQAGNTDRDACVRLIHRAPDPGTDFVHTADAYGPGGESDEIVGRALKGRRDDIMPTTKVNGSMGEDLNRGGGSRRWIVTEAEHPLRHLQTGHGCIAIAREVVPACRRYGVGTPVWSPPAMGLHTGRCRGSRPEAPKARMNRGPRHLAEARKLDAVAQVIPPAEEAGPRTREQFEDLSPAARTTRDDEALNRTDQIVAPATDIGPLDGCCPPAMTRAALRRRSADERAAA